MAATIIVSLCGCRSPERAAEEDSLSASWELAAKYRFNEALRWFRDVATSKDDASLSSRMARYGEALSLLNAIPRTSGNIKLADGIFAELAEGPEEDIDKIQTEAELSVDWEETERRYERLCDLYDGILRIEKRGPDFMWFAPMDLFIQWR